MAKRIPPASSMGLFLSITREINALTFHAVGRRCHSGVTPRDACQGKETLCAFGDKGTNTD